MAAGKLFAWLVLIPVVLGSDNIKHIWCTDKDSKNHQRYLIQGLKEEEMLCEAVLTDGVPWTLGERKNTPPAPDSMEAKYQIYRTDVEKDTWKIAVNISWLYRVKYFNYVEQYHLELNYVIPYGMPNHYLMRWDRNLTSFANNTSATFLKFHFIYSEIPGTSHINPEDEYRLRIQSVPIYGENDIQQSLEILLTIPGCENENISRTVKCMYGYNGLEPEVFTMNIMELKTDYAVEMETTNVNDGSALWKTDSEHQGNQSSLIVLLVIGCFLIAIIGLIIAILWICKTKKVTCVNNAKQQLANGSRRVLLACTADDRFLKLINQLIAMLGKFPDLEVRCNLRQKNEIGDKGIQSWTAQEINDADVIAFIVANAYELTEVEMSSTEKGYSGLERVEQLQVGVIIKAAEKICLNNSDIIEQKTFVLVDIANCCDQKTAPYFKRFKLPEDFGDLMKTVAGEAAVDGKNSGEDEKSSFLRDLDIAQKQNNLDFMSLTSTKDIDCTFHSLNVTSDGPPSCQPPSCESNESLQYNTTDFNDGPDRLERFRYTGAIPKA